jgi:Fe-S cluster assembly ATP-binding protein
MLEIRELFVDIENKHIIKGLNLNVKAGEIHAIMGPNGAGKSTLSHVLSGKPGYDVISGSILYHGEDLVSMPAEIRAREGVSSCLSIPC